MQTHKHNLDVITEPTQVVKTCEKLNNFARPRCCQKISLKAY